MSDMGIAEPWPRRPRRLAIAVVDELVDRLVGAEIPAGSSLPAEPVLCQTFGVSRTVAREAVKSLEALRLVTVQQGQGTRARPLADWDLLDPLVLAAVIRHGARMTTLDAEVDDATTYLRADGEFHDAIMVASGNRLGRAMIHTLQVEAYRLLRYVGDPASAEMRLSNVAHRAVHDAVLTGDAVAAEAAMREHIIGSWHRRRPGAKMPANR